MIISPSSLNKLGIEQMVDYGGSWMKTISKYLLISNRVSVRDFFSKIL